MNLGTKILGGLVGAGAIAMLLRGDSTPGLSSVSPRTRVATAARSQLGSNDNAKYWASALPGQNPKGLDWCGAFALWSLHEAGLATDWLWKIGSGFLMTAQHSLPITNTPQMGDIAYFDKFQHEAVVLSVDPISRTVQLANGNGTGGMVSLSSIPWNSVTAFFSIEPLLANAGV